MSSASRLAVAACLSALACNVSADRDRKAAFLYVSNEGSNDVTIVDVATERVVRTIPVGRRPRGLTLSPDRKLLYVALSGSPRGGPHVDESTLPAPDRDADGIGVVELESGRFREKIVSGSDPEAFHVAPDGRLLVVASEDAARATLLERATRRVVAGVAVGAEPEGVRFAPGGRFAYVTSEAEHRVDVVDVVLQRVVGRIPTGERPRDVAFTADGARAFVSAEIGGTVEVIDTRAMRRVASVRIPGEPRAKPMGMALDEGGRRLYVSTGRGGRVAIVDTERLAFEGAIEGVGARPWGIALNADGSKLYTANGPSNDVSVIDTRSRRVVSKIRVGELPWGLTLPRR